MNDFTLVGIDNGATNTRGVLLDPFTGDIIDTLFVYHNNDIRSPDEMFQKIYDGIIRLGDPKNVGIGIAAAGVIDKKKAIILMSPNMPNFKNNIDFPFRLRELGYPVTTANDLEAAALGEFMFGQGKGSKNLAVATYSSGYNYGVIADGKLLPRTIEGGHQIYKGGNNIRCACGGLDHLESYLSGNGARYMAFEYLKRMGIIDHTILKEIISDIFPTDTIEHLSRLVDQGFCDENLNHLTAKHVYRAYRKNPSEEPQASIRECQVNGILNSFSQMISNHSPLEKIICMGSQTKDWDILFEEAIKRYKENIPSYHHPSLFSPEIVKSNDPMIGAKGAGAYFMHQFPEFFKAA